MHAIRHTGSTIYLPPPPKLLPPKERLLRAVDIDLPNPPERLVEDLRDTDDLFAADDRAPEDERDTDDPLDRPKPPLRPDEDALRT